MASTEGEDLLFAAQQQMRRRLPQPDGAPPAKKAKTEGAAGEQSDEEEANVEIMRFNYSAASDLGKGGAAFFITCGFRREKRATREVVAILQERLAAAALGKEEEPAAPSQADAPAAADSSSGSPGPALSVVKLGCCGVVMLMLSSGEAGAGGEAAAARLAQRIGCEVILGVAASERPRLEHAQRVLPILTTCKPALAELEAAGRKLAWAVAEAATAGPPGGDAGAETDAAAGSSSGAPGEQPPRSVSFGISYKEKRGNADSGAGEEAPARGAALAAIARGLTAALKEEHGVTARVDLKRPEVVVFAETLPLASSVLVGLAALPGELCASGSRLAPLLLGPEAAAKKKGQ